MKEEAAGLGRQGRVRGAGVKGTSWGCCLVSFAWEVGGQLRKRKKG